MVKNTKSTPRGSHPFNRWHVLLPKSSLTPLSSRSLEYVKSVSTYNHWVTQIEYIENPTYEKGMELQRGGAVLVPFLFVESSGRSPVQPSAFEIRTINSFPKHLRGGMWETSTGYTPPFDPIIIFSRPTTTFAESPTRLTLVQNLEAVARYKPFFAEESPNVAPAVDPYMQILSDWARSAENPANIRINRSHILGELNQGGSGTGGHIRNPNLRVDSIITPDRGDGVYVARVSIRDPITGDWTAKQGAGISTMWPDHWSYARIQQTIYEAWVDAGRPVSGGRWYGRSRDGFGVTGWPMNPQKPWFDVYSDWPDTNVPAVSDN
jgi:hypothetical protein